MNDLGPQPTPEPETPEKFPGGADSIEDPEKYGDYGHLEGPAPRDLDPDSNPAVDDVAPEAITEPDEEKKQAPEGQADDQEAGSVGDPEAGQQDEKGEPEQPA